MYEWTISLLQLYAEIYLIQDTNTVHPNFTDTTIFDLKDVEMDFLYKTHKSMDEMMETM